MSAPRRLYSKAEIRLLAGAPGALARPPNLLAFVDRSKYEKHVSPDRGHGSVKVHHKNQKQRPAAAHVSSQISPAQQKWKPKHDDHRSRKGYTTRHWDQTPASVVNNEEEPEWADEVVDYNENFDFSQAMLERDKDRPEQSTAAVDSSPAVPASVPQMSRFGFALEDTADMESLGQIRQPVLAVSEQEQTSKSQPLEYSQIRHSRFKFTQIAALSVDDVPPTLQQHAIPSSQFGARRELVEDSHSDNSRAFFMHQQEMGSGSHAQFRPEETPAPPLHMELHPAHIPFMPPNGAAPNQPPTPVPKGKPIEISQMFQMYALAKNLPPTPSAPPIVSSQSMRPPSHHGVPIQMNLQPSSNQMSALGSTSAYHTSTMPADLYNPTLPRTPPPGFRTSISGLQIPSIPVRPLTIAGLGQPQPSTRQVSQASSTRSKSSSSERRRNRDESGQSSNRPKAPVPAPAAPPSYVRSYMNIQMPPQPANAGYYVPPGMTTNPAQGFMGHHQMPYHPPSPPLSNK